MSRCKFAYFRSQNKQESPGIFLWQGNIEGHHSARVSWEQVTKPKIEGGLGINDLSVWNKACCLKLIWLLFFQSGSIWVAWFCEEVLLGDLSNLWITTPHRRFSCRFWTDNWSTYGNMRDYLQLGSNSSLGIQEMATLASLHSNGAWLLPPARSDRQVEVHTLLTTIQLVDGDDTYEWEIEGKVYKSYSIGMVYSHLRDQGVAVTWSNAVWNKGGIPRHSFLTWLFVLNRCPTRDRILGWGLQTSPLCLLCNSASESRDHLYFDCPYTWSLWGAMALRCGITPERNWARSLAQLQVVNRKTPTGILTLLCWQGCIYWSWTERNARLHRNIFRSSDSISALIDRQLRDRILSFRDQNPRASSMMMQRWLS